MKTRLDRYILGSVLKVGFLAMLLCAFILSAVDLIGNLESYIQLEVPFGTIALRTLYYLPEALMISSGPAFLFSITYFLSMLQANNELICLLNSGISYRRIIRPILLAAVAVSLLYFIFNETVGIQALKKKELLNDKIFLNSSSYDNRDITLNDREGGYLLYARKYSESSQELTDTVLVKKSPDSKLLWKMNSQQALWNPEIGNWEFYGNKIYQIDGSQVQPQESDKTVAEGLNLGPELFRNLKDDIKTMELKLAWEHLGKIKEYDPNQYAATATDFFQRFFSCLTPIVLMIIACSVNYRFKKNILLFSIVWCLCIGVVYYVVQMLCLIMAHQGMIRPEAGMLVPFGVILILASILSLTFKT